ncbi:innexin unc-7-like [Watersipora subatra]|uniref:innexin unc-7-like n=1 Tax=Watersipora subatra TaxID=2589382 RepID=UPI00355B2F48
MVATDMITALQEGSRLASNRDDDMYDRLSNRWSVGLIIAFALLISSSSYIGDPIDCYEPQEFEDNWIEYMDNICWIANTYYVPWNESIPNPDQPYKQELQYYQWVPIILTIQAALFLVPAAFWNMVAQHSGYGIKDIVKSCRDMEMIEPEKRDETIAFLASNMIRFINYRQPYKSRKSPMGKRYGNFVFIMYLFSKCLYIINAIIQIFLLDYILGDGYHIFGYQALVNMLWKVEWNVSPMFPRITLCSFEIRRLGSNIHRYTVQCLLSVNLFNEKVYMIIWWWLIFVAGMSILGLLLWLANATSPGAQRTYVRKYLKIMGLGGNREDEVEEFTNFLRLDGVFTLRQIAKNTNDAVCGEVVKALWEKYQKENKNRLNYGETESLA